VDEWCDDEQKDDVFDTEICGKPVGGSKSNEVE